MYTPITTGKNLRGPSKASSIASSILVLDFFTRTFNLLITIFEKTDLKIIKIKSITIATKILFRSIPKTPWLHTDSTKFTKFSIC